MVSWDAYFSDDDQLDAGDSPIADGLVDALGAGDSDTITLDTQWSAIAGNYCVIITLEADDDENPDNDTVASAALSATTARSSRVPTAITEPPPRPLPRRRTGCAASAT